MTATDLVLTVIGAFERLAIPYMLVGSFSSNMYGRPRSTKDADFVVQLGADSLRALVVEIGPGFEVDAQMSFESLTGTTRHVIAHRASAFKIELFLLSSDEHDQARFARRRPIAFEGRAVAFPSPEDVIVTKLRWAKGGNRAKDVEDVRHVLRQRTLSLDLEYIRQWADRHGTRSAFEELLLVERPGGEDPGAGAEAT